MLSPSRISLLEEMAAFPSHVLCRELVEKFKGGNKLYIDSAQIVRRASDICYVEREGNGIVIGRTGLLTLCPTKEDFTWMISMLFQLML